MASPSGSRSFASGRNLMPEVHTRPAFARIGRRAVVLRDSPIPFAGLLAFTVVLLLAPQAWFPILAKLRIALLIAIVALVAHTADRLSRGQPVITWTRELRLALCLLAWTVVTIPFSLWPGGSVNVITELYSKSLIIFWLLGETVSNQRRFLRVGWMLALLSVPLAMTGVRNYLSGQFIDAGHSVTRIIGYEGALTQNPNDLAMLLNLLLPIAVALLMGSRTVVARVSLLGIVLLIVLGMVATFSRTGFLTLITTVLVYGWKLRRRPQRRWFIGLALTSLVLLPFAPSEYRDRIATIIEVENDETQSAQHRLRDMITASGYVLTHPVIGAGIGQDILALNDARGAAWLNVHSAYLQYGIDLAWPGLLLFLLLLIGCIRSTIQAQREARRVPGLRRLELLAEGVQISLIAFAVGAFFSPVAYHFQFYYFGGLAIATKRAVQTEARRWTPGGPRGR